MTFAQNRYLAGLVNGAALACIPWGIFALDGIYFALVPRAVLAAQLLLSRILRRVPSFRSDTE